MCQIAGEIECQLCRSIQLSGWGELPRTSHQGLSWNSLAAQSPDPVFPSTDNF